jgi:hypothetical protein
MRTRPSTRRWGSRRGTNAAEFALILPTFIFLIMTLMDFGWLFFQRTTLDMAATVGCRAGALVDPGDEERFMSRVQDRADAAMRAELLRSGAGECDDDTCYTDVIAYGASPGRSLLCVVGRDIEPLVGLALEPMTLESSIAVRMEWQRWAGE